MALLCLVLNLTAQEKLNVLSSASIFEDMARNIGGEMIDLKSIVPIGGDPHLYEPSPSDAQLLQKTDLVLMNGLTFEGWIKKLIENSGSKAAVKTITEGVTPIASEDYANAYDPHAWMDASNGVIYANNILDALVKADPKNEAAYRANHKKYVDELNKVHNYILDEVKKIPEAQRVVITSHDAFSYFGKAYGLKLNAIKGISTEEEAQSSDIMRVSKVIKNSNVPAIFIESTINPKLIKQIATDNGVVVGGELFADSLGPKDEESGTYIGMLKHNADVIVKALSGKGVTETKIDADKGGSSNMLLYVLLGALMLGALVFAARKMK